MKVISTNLAHPQTVLWRGKEVTTGIFKYPEQNGIVLQKENVATDAVIDRKHHGGEFKACYLFASDQYGYWKDKYPDLDWNWGMFGENLTVQGLDEQQLFIGDTYKIGSAVVQITEPRQPCFKLGIRFGNQKILKEFIDHGYSGTYVRIKEEGQVQPGDRLRLIKKTESTLTTYQYNNLINTKDKNKSWVEQAISNDSIRWEKREKLKK